MKRILVVSGTRADYGIYYPILQAIEADPSLELHLLITGMHLSPQHGYTVNLIKNDGFRISAQVDTLLQGATHANMSRGIGLAILGMTQSIEVIEPDVVIVLGDRGEMLAASIVSSHMNIPLVHLHGGEVSGTIDESVRHAISKLAHIHLVATEGSKERLIKLGEDPWRIHLVGAPRIETMMNTTLPELACTLLKYKINISTNKYILFAYHPVTTLATDLLELNQMLEVLYASEMDIICVMPNSDAGADTILEVYDRFLRKYGSDKIHCVTSFEQLDYLTILRHAEVLVGNSSSGIIEAASYHTPVINIGNRQGRRERSANVVDITENGSELQSAVDYVLSSIFQQRVELVNNVYYRENTSNSIVEILKQISSSDDVIQKTITY
ncbi:UDP-N-acetylglucosamine 2-epimerase [Paenibacillus sp. CMAA1364]